MKKLGFLRIPRSWLLSGLSEMNHVIHVRIRFLRWIVAESRVELHGKTAQALGIQWSAGLDATNALMIMMEHWIAISVDASIEELRVMTADPLPEKFLQALKSREFSQHPSVHLNQGDRNSPSTAHWIRRFSPQTFSRAEGESNLLYPLFCGVLTESLFIERVRPSLLSWQRSIQENHFQSLVYHLCLRFPNFRKCLSDDFLRHCYLEFQRGLQLTVQTQSLFDKLVRLAKEKQLPFSILGDFAFVHICYPQPAFRPCHSIDILFDEAYAEVFHEIAETLGLKVIETNPFYRTYSLPASPALVLRAHQHLWHCNLHQILHHTYYFEGKPMLSFRIEDLILERAAFLLTHDPEPYQILDLVIALGQLDPQQTEVLKARSTPLLRASLADLLNRYTPLKDLPVHALLIQRMQKPADVKHLFWFRKIRNKLSEGYWAEAFFARGLSVKGFIAGCSLKGMKRK